MVLKWRASWVSGSREGRISQRLSHPPRSWMHSQQGRQRIVRWGGSVYFELQHRECSRSRTRTLRLCRYVCGRRTVYLSASADTLGEKKHYLRHWRYNHWAPSKSDNEKRETKSCHFLRTMKLLLNLLIDRGVDRGSASSTWNTH